MQKTVVLTEDDLDEAVNGWRGFAASYLYLSVAAVERSQEEELSENYPRTMTRWCS